MKSFIIRATRGNVNSAYNGFLFSMVDKYRDSLDRVFLQLSKVFRFGTALYINTNPATSFFSPRFYGTMICSPKQIFSISIC